MAGLLDKEAACCTASPTIQPAPTDTAPNHLPDTPADTDAGTPTPSTTPKKKKHKGACFHTAGDQQRSPCAGERDIDFSQYRTRYVAMHIMYNGEQYSGLAAQAEGLSTIEGALFDGLTRARLIPPNATWHSLRYSRCGRTDKGVSALGQVVALLLRSKAKANEPLPAPDAETDLCAALNRHLPLDIRALGWADVPENFSARFSCAYRHYKYFFTDYQHQLDVQAMRDAARRLVGIHDFRNMCKMDVEKMHNLTRVVWHASVTPLGVEAPVKAPPPECFAARDLAAVWQQQAEGYLTHAAACASADHGGGGHDVYVLDIVGSAFLWHQVCVRACVRACVR